MKSGVFCIVLVLSTICGALPALGSDGDQPTLFSATDLKETSRRTIPFDENRNMVSVAEPDGTHKLIQVELSRISYHGTAVKPAASGMITEPGTWHCYELESKDKDVSYKWSIWSGYISGRFKLFVTPGGDTYLTWVDSSTLCFAEVSKPMDESEKMKRLNDRLNSTKIAGVQYVDVSRLIDQEQFVDDKATDHYASIYLTSLEKDGTEGFRLQLHGNDPSKVYALVTDKVAEFGWRVE